MFRRITLLLGLVAGLAVPAATTAPYAHAGNKQRVIVVLNDGVNARGFAVNERARHGADINFVYGEALTGFAATVPVGRLGALRNDPRVAYVELDQRVSIAAQETPTGIERIFADTNAAIDIDGQDDFRVDVDVAILDTGIDRQHPDLNVVDGITCLSSLFGEIFGIPVNCGGDGDDDHYHGTHVAGTVAALDNGFGVVGVAPGARLHSVKVLDSSGSGYTSGIVAGIDWVIAQGDIEVANMSLGGPGLSTAYQQALGAAKAAGVAFAVAAGNDSSDASGFSPAAYGDAAYGRLALTVSALADFDGAPGGAGSATCRADEDDTLANFSNFGSPVSIIAPGVCILSTYPLERGDYGTISGTSMASPHVAGGLALLASSAPNGPSVGTAAVDGLFDAVVGAGSSNWNNADDGDNVKEPLLDVSTFSPTMVGDGGGDPPPPPPDPDTTAPTVSITSPPSGATFNEGDTITFTGTASDAGDPNVDGSDLSWEADGSINLGTGSSVSTSSLGVGTHSIVASATDASGNTGTASISVEVVAEPPPPSALVLTANGYKQRGRHVVDLTWTGASEVAVYRDGNPIANVNGSSYTDRTGNRGQRSYRYQVCDATSCSNMVTVEF